MHNSINVQKLGPQSSHLSQPFLGFWVIPINPHFITCDNIQSNYQFPCKPLLKVLAHDDTIRLLLLTKHTRHKIVGMFRLAVKMISTDTKFPSCQQTSKIVIPPCPKTSSLTQSTFSTAQLADGCRKPSASSTQVTLFLKSECHSKPVFFPFPLSKNYFQYFKCFCSILPLFTAKSDPDTVLSSLLLSRYATITNAITTHLYETGQQPGMLQCYLKQKMTNQMRFYLHLGVKVCVSSSSAISQSVPKLLTTPHSCN